jgi:hypothetical protein
MRHQKNILTFLLILTLCKAMGDAPKLSDDLFCRLQVWCSVFPHLAENHLMELKLELELAKCAADYVTMPVQFLERRPYPHTNLP